jgi:CRISPR/Cas system-associated exonuclease Cas4 (RecB family)
VSEEVKPLRISWSRLRASEECPAKGHLLSLGKKAPGSDIRMFFHGIVVDSCMRQWLLQDQPEKGWMLKHVYEIFEQDEKKAVETGDGVVRWKSPGDKAEVLGFCRDLVIELEKILEVECLPYDWQGAKRFSVSVTVPYLDGTPRLINLVGETDLLVLRPDGLGVYDLKATRDTNYWRKVKAQMVFYYIAMRIMKGEWPVRSALIQPMCKEQVFPFEFTEDDVRDLMTRICKLATDIWSGRIAPKESADGCKDCFVRHACPKYAKTGGRTQLLSIGGPTGG